jgi:hypothetical protein
MMVIPVKTAWLHPQKIFDLLFKVLLLILAIITISIFIFYLTRGELKGVFLLLFIVVATLWVFRTYWSAIDRPSERVSTADYEITGELEALADMIYRASCDLEYSREKLEDIVRDVVHQDETLSGTGDEWLQSLKEILDEA